MFRQAENKMIVTPEAREFLKKAIEEDVGKRDITSESVFPVDFQAEAVLIAKDGGVLAGIDFFREIFRLIDRKLKFQGFPADGRRLAKGEKLGKVSGSVKSILKGERVALNVLSHLSGIAALTAAFVRETGGVISILDTRKTLPGLRYLEKYAVTAGGGKNHRLRMDELVLIKDNHLNAWVLKTGVSRLEAIRFLTGNARQNLSSVIPADTLKSVTPADSRRGRESRKYLRCSRIQIEVEVENCREALAAWQSGAGIVMFDNTGPAEIKKFLRLAGGKRPVIEISGGINLQNIKKFVGLPVDWISVGALTNSAPAIDFSLKIRHAG